MPDMTDFRSVHVKSFPSHTRWLVSVSVATDENLSEIMGDEGRIQKAWLRVK